MASFSANANLIMYVAKFLGNLHLNDMCVCLLFCVGFGINPHRKSTCFFFKQKTAYEISACLVGSEMCIRDSKKNLLGKKSWVCNEGMIT